MESDLRYFRRRAAAEALAARRSITPEAQARHLELANRYQALILAEENGINGRSDSVRAVAAA